MLRHSEEQRFRLVAKEEMRRFAVLTLRLFRRDGQPPSAEMFWAEVARKEPLLDPWGSPYQLRNHKKEERAFEWLSAGPDRIYGSADDLNYAVPYGDGINLDLTQPGMDPSLDNRVIDAR